MLDKSKVRQKLYYDEIKYRYNFNIENLVLLKNELGRKL